MLPAGRFRAVLFDLDGTLADTALDMVEVLQDLQKDHAREPVGYETGRSHVSNGAQGLLRIAFPDLGDDIRQALLDDYLVRYAKRVCAKTRLFEGIGDLLTRLELGKRPWGVVTNKPQRLTDPLLAGLSLTHRLACTVSGDTLPQRKPDPAPLLYACGIAGVEPQRTLYVGDAARDIEAGKRAGMGTVAAAYGYIPAGDSAFDWDADAVAGDTGELAKIVLEAVNL